MTLHLWWLFVVAVFLLCGTPGPNMLHVMTRSVAFGARRSIAAMAGCLCALVLVLAASAAGVSALLAAWPRVFDALRYAGVAYLVFLGIKAWRGAGAPVDVGSDALPVAASARRLFRGGFVIGISNPKLLLFAAGKLPSNLFELLEKNFGDLPLHGPTPAGIPVQTALEKSYRVVNDPQGAMFAVFKFVAAPATT